MAELSTQDVLTSFGKVGSRNALVCIAHAGAGAAPFSGWVEPLSGIATVWAARFPGRESRILEPPLTRIVDMVGELSGAVEALDADEIAFFGHCAGATVAYECVRQMCAKATISPAALIVSSQEAPAHGRHAPSGSRRGVPDLASYLGEAGGTDKALLDDAEFLALMAPTVMADFDAVNSYSRPEDRPALNIPIIAVAGRDDTVGPAELISWRELALGKFEVRTFEGGHFYFNTATTELVSFFRSIFYCP